MLSEPARVCTPQRSDLRKRQLSVSRQRLITLIGRVHFGRIEELHVVNGEPSFDPVPRVIRTLKMNGKNTPRLGASASDFLLRSEVVELLEHLAHLGNGVVKRIEVAHGLPLLAEIQDVVTA